MALNNFGLGLVLTAEDLATKVIQSVSGSLAKLAADPKKVQDAFREVGGELKKTSVALLGLSAAAAAGLGLAARESAKFESAVAEVASIADAAEFPVSKIADLSKDLATTFGGDPSEQAKALYNAISSGATTAAKATDLLGTANKLAIGGLTDVNTSIKALTTVFNTGIKGASDFTAVSDAMFQTVNLGQGNMEELASVIGNVAPTAAALGVDIDELSAAMAAGSLKLGTFAKTADGLQEVLSNIVKPTSDAEKEAKKLGIQFNLAGLQSQGLSKLLFEVAAKSKNPTESFNQLFGSTTALKTVLALMGDDAKIFAGALKSMSDKGGATDRAFKTLAQTTEFAEKVLQGNLKTALINIGDALAPLIGTVLTAANAFLKWFNGLPKPVFKVIGLMGLLAVKVGFVLGVAFGLTGAVLGLIAAGKVALITFVAIVGVLSGVGLALAAVGFAAFGLYQAVQENVGGIGDFFRDLYTKGKLLVDGITQLFEQGGFSGPVLEQLNAGNQGIKDFAIQVYLWGNRLLGFFDGVKQGFSNALAAAKPALDQFKLALSSLLNAFGVAKDAPDEAGKKFQSFADAGASMGKTLGRVFEFLVEAITAGMRVARGFVDGLKTMAPVFAQVWTAVQNVIGAFTSMGAATGSSGSAWESFGQKVGYVVGFIGAGVAFLSNLFAVHMTVLTSAISGVIGFLGGLMSVFQGVWNVIAGILTGDWRQVWTGVVQIVSGSVQAIISLVASVVSAIAGVGDIVGKILGKDLGMKSFVEGVKGDALKAVAAGPGAMAKDAAGIVQGTPTVAGGPSGLVMPPAAVPAQAPLIAAGATVPAAAAGAQAGSIRDAVAGMSRNAASTPVQVEAKTTLVVDGEVLANTVTKHQQAGQARSFGAVPSPT